MSRKLQALIQDIKGLPGKYKRVLLAWASFANNDGTNIYPSKESVGTKAGVSRWTVYDNTKPLEAAGVLQRTGSHVCRSEKCNKGGTHWTNQHGQYTAVYKLNVALLGNPTVLLQKIADATVEKSNSGSVGKTEKGTVGKPDATQALKETPAPASPTLGTQDSSVLTDGVREQVSFSPAPRPASPEDRGGTPPAPPVALGLGTEEAKQNQNQNRIEEGFYTEDVFTDEGYLLGTIMPKPSAAAIEKGLPLCRRILAHFSDADDYAGIAAEMVLKYNRAHRGQKYATKDDKAMYLRTPEQYLKALESENATLMNDYLTHDFEKCELCVNAGAMDYRALIREIREKERHAAEQKRAEVARLKEAERLAKLCERCKKHPHGSMYLEHSRDYRNNAIMVRVCDGCYDGAYEARKNYPGTRAKMLDKRPGYNPPKFDTSAWTPDLGKALAAWFKDNGKVGEWTTSKEEREALGVSADHLTGVLRYLHKSQEKVTREQFVALLLECAAERPKAAEPEPTAMFAAGDEL